MIKRFINVFKYNQVIIKLKHFLINNRVGFSDTVG